MSFDIQDIHEFYDHSLGLLAQTYIDRKIASLWRDVKDDLIVGYGYPLPYLERYRTQARGVFALMPSFLGALAWPPESANLVALTSPDIFPLVDYSVDKFLMVHALEHSSNPLHLIRECWRVLKEGGNALIIVPNRRGLWAGNTSTPFGSGEPFSGRQLYNLVQKSLFSPHKPVYALFTPPLPYRIILRSADAIEHFGAKRFKKFGGVTLIEMKKEILSLIPPNLKQIPKPLFIPSST